jgi:hypothetical protein
MTHSTTFATPKYRRPKKFCKASPIKRIRRTKAEINGIRGGIYAILSELRPMTVRQVYYQCVSRGIIEKTEPEYDTVCRLLAKMRREKQVPFSWISDSTRWQRKPTTHSSLDDALQNTLQTYRRAVWDNQKCYVEIWLEKDAMAGVIYDVTWDWDVPLMVTRGYPSLSYIYNAAECFAAQDRPCYLYYLGDHDPSGVDIPRRVERDIRNFAPDAEIYFERVAVNPKQIEEYALPTRPTKKTDTRSKNFKGESVEVDALPPEVLREIVSNCIEQHINRAALNRLHVVEAAERETLQTMIEGIGGGAA